MRHTNEIRKVLSDLSPDAAPFRVSRERLEEGWADGYLVGIGPEFFAVHLVDKGVWLDGFTAVRYDDVSSLESPAPYAAFIDRVFQLRGLEPATSAPADLSSVSALVRTAGAAYSVVTLHFELVDPEVCYIGKVLSVDDESVAIRPIGPDGEWDVDEEAYPLCDLTRVDFGGSYEEALVLCGGEG